MLVKKILIQTGSILLLLMFSVIQIVPALHHHTDTVNSSQVSAEISGKHTLGSHSADCLICNFLAHKQVDYPSQFSALSISIFVTKPVTCNTDYSRQLFETAVHSWTNKGPPTI